MGAVCHAKEHKQLIDSSIKTRPSHFQPIFSYKIP